MRQRRVQTVDTNKVRSVAECIIARVSGFAPQPFTDACQWVRDNNTEYDTEQIEAGIRMAKTELKEMGF